MPKYDPAGSRNPAGFSGEIPQSRGIEKTRDLVNRSSEYGFQQEQEILVSWFFEFLVSWQEMGDKKQEIDFLHFLVNFDQIVGLFDDF